MPAGSADICLIELAHNKFINAYLSEVKGDKSISF